MTNNQTNIIALIAFGMYILYNILSPSESTISNAILSHAIEGVCAVLLFYILIFLQNIKQLRLFFETKILYRNKKIRLSFAYLFRIKIDNKYLLIKNSHNGFFQPVGGVFKTLPGSEKIFEKLNVTPDRLIETEKGIAKGDLRVYVEGKNVINFFKWFKTNEDRETSPWREFCEELISTKILPWKEFRYIDYKFRGIVRTPLINLDNGDKGLFHYEIYDLVINNEQEPILKILKNKGDKENHVWVDEYLINNLGLDEREKKYICRINPHTKWAHNLKWSKS